MATVDPALLARYFDERGRAVIIHEHQLRELGLNVVKSEFGQYAPGSGQGGVLTLYDLSFTKRDKHFGAELVTYLKQTVGLSDEEIKRLDEQSTHRPEHF